jgi:methylmalonyl-CoA/ethylmalonyl-CoA epimerase
MDLRLGELGQIAMPVRDLDRASAFYRDKLKLAPLFTAPGLAFFDCAGVRLMLAMPETPEFDHPGSVLYFLVPEIQAAHDELASRGVRFRGAPHVIAKMPTYDLWMAFFDDGEGNVLAIMSEAPRV